jgi:hypothetical protein
MELYKKIENEIELYNLENNIQLKDNIIIYN